MRIAEHDWEEWTFWLVNVVRRWSLAIRNPNEANKKIRTNKQTINNLTEYSVGSYTRTLHSLPSNRPIFSLFTNFRRCSVCVFSICSGLVRCARHFMRLTFIIYTIRWKSHFLIYKSCSCSFVSIGNARHRRQTATRADTSIADGHSRYEYIWKCVFGDEKNFHRRSKQVNTTRWHNEKWTKRRIGSANIKFIKFMFSFSSRHNEKP